MPFTIRLTHCMRQQFYHRLHQDYDSGSLRLVKRMHVLLAISDGPFYHCAITGYADAIVTDNVADFPPAPGRKRPAILTPAAAVAQPLENGDAWRAGAWA